ncbi:MAG: hypothetical protein RL681_39 [Candidatus Parcubacteria bacterium]|jgi:transporter family protein
MWLLYAVLSAITAALVAILGKLGLKNIDPTLATTVRSIIMAVFLVAVSVALGKFSGFSAATFTVRDWQLIAASGIAGALSWLFYFVALKYGLATKVVVIDRLSLVFVVVLAALFLGEQLTWRSILGTVLMVAGALLITFK